MSSVTPFGPAGACAPNVIPLRPRQSSEIGFGQKSHAARRVRDPLAAYAGFADRWMAFVREFFSSPAEVSEFFRVSTKAAEKWWNGIGGAHGAKLDYALDEIEGALEWWHGAQLARIAA